MSCWQSPGQGHGRAPGGSEAWGWVRGSSWHSRNRGPGMQGGCQGRSMALPHSIANVRGLCWGARQLS